MNIAEVPLVVGQRILVDTTQQDRQGEAIKLHQTTVKDVIVRDGEVRVVMAPGGWGACPTRAIDRVIWDRESYDAFIERKGAPEGGEGELYKAHSGPWERILKVRADGEEQSLVNGHRLFFRCSMRRGYGGYRWDIPASTPLEYAGFRADYADAVEDLWEYVERYLKYGNEDTDE